ncbi:MAG: hypothetical protein C0434_10685 [Xanthomonadaceae bacterium]|nr:hypothetical protein [Xanthomonadaceae bacterium]
MSVQTSSAVSAIQATVAVDRFGVSASVPNSGPVVGLSSVDQPASLAVTDVAPEPAQLAQAVDDLNQRFKDGRTDLRFSVDEDSGQMVVSIVDAADGKVLRQMPTEEALRVAKALDKALGTLIERVA